MSGANKAAMYEINASSEIPIIVRQVKYLNNIVEQDHRAVKRVTKPMLNFKSFRSAKCALAGIELMHTIRKDQFMLQGCAEMSLSNQFYAWRGGYPPSLRGCHSPPPEARSSAVNATKPTGQPMTPASPNFLLVLMFQFVS